MGMMPTFSFENLLGSDMIIKRCFKLSHGVFIRITAVLNIDARSRAYPGHNYIELM